MNDKSEINSIQKRLLVRLNVRKGTTLFTIIEAITRQAYVKESFTVSQKNSTLAKKCNVTASTVSRNLKKLKEKCSDLITIEQNRNVEERFASLIFTLIPQVVSNGMSNGCQSKPVNTGNECIEVAENTSSLTTVSHVLIKNNNKDLYTNIVNKEKVNKENAINELYIEFSQKGINKNLFQRVLKEIQEKQGIINYKAYLRSCLNTVAYRVQVKLGYIDPIEKIKSNMKNSGIVYYDWLNE